MSVDELDQMVVLDDAYEQREEYDELVRRARRASARPSVPASAVLDGMTDELWCASYRMPVTWSNRNDVSWKAIRDKLAELLSRADAITVDHEPATPPSEGADDEDFPSIRKSDYDEQEGR